MINSLREIDLLNAFPVTLSWILLPQALILLGNKKYLLKSAEDVQKFAKSNYKNAVLR